MGRIDAEIPDELETKLRVEIIKRFGGRKGDLQRAMQEAIESWINRQTVEKLKVQATNENLLPSERKEATKILGEMGDSAVEALLEIGNASRLLPSERDTAREMTKRILKKNL